MNNDLQFQYEICFVGHGVKEVNDKFERYNFRSLMSMSDRNLLYILRNGTTRTVCKAFKEMEDEDILDFCNDCFQEYEEAESERKRRITVLRFFKNVAGKLNREDLSVWSCRF